MLPLSTNVRLQILPCPPRADTHGWHSTSGRMPDKGEVTVMEVVHQRCAGLDISKSDAKLCVRTPGSRHRTFDKKVTVWGSFSNEVARLREHLIAEGSRSWSWRPPAITGSRSCIGCRIARSR